MSAYIQGMGNISPQKTWDESRLLAQPLVYAGDRLSCHEPDYSKYIDPKQLRRMSRIIKMGVAAGSMALKNAGIAVPNGIITGTAYGCLEDTGIFEAAVCRTRNDTVTHRDAQIGRAHV